MGNSRYNVKGKRIKHHHHCALENLFKVPHAEGTKESQAALLRASGNTRGCDPVLLPGQVPSIPGVSSARASSSNFSHGKGPES